MNNKTISEIILEKLEKQKFADWYGPGGRFDQYISGDADLVNGDMVTMVTMVTKEDILDDIKKMFSNDIKEMISETISTELAKSGFNIQL